MPQPDATSSPLLLHAAFTALGLAAFALSNALWAEMSALYRRLPEGERLAAYMIVALQLANVLPAYLMITTRTSDSLHPPPPAPQRSRGLGWWWGLEGAIVVLLASGFALCLLLAGMWDNTAHVGGSEHAVRLFVLTFLVGCVNNTSGLAMYPFVARWPIQYTSALATGEGLAGVVVAIIAAAQNAGGSRLRWGVGGYFVVVGLVIYSSATIGFIYLLRHQAKPFSLSPDPGSKEGDDLPSPPPVHQAEEGQGVSTWGVLRRIVPSLRVQFVLAALSFGAVPALVPQACQAYQHQARVLQYSSALSMTMDPVSRALTHSFQNYRLHTQLLAVVGCAVVLLCCASLGDGAPLSGLEYGGLLVVLANGLFTTLFAFASTMVYLSIRHELDPPNPAPQHDAECAQGAAPLLQGEEGSERLKARRQREAQEGYKWSAFTIQGGAFIGSIAVLAFTLAR